MNHTLLNQNISLSNFGTIDGYSSVLDRHPQATALQRRQKLAILQPRGVANAFDDMILECISDLSGTEFCNGWPGSGKSGICGREDGDVFGSLNCRGQIRRGESTG